MPDGVHGQRPNWAIASVQATTATLIGIKFGDQPVTSTVDAYWPQSTAHWNQVSATNTFPVNTGFVDETGAAVTSGLSVVCVGNGNVLKNGDAFEAEVQPNWTPWPGPNIPGNVSPVGALAYGGLGTAREGGAQITISGIPAGSHVAILESWLNCSATWDMIQPGDLAHHVILWGPTEGSTSLYVDPGTGLQTFYWQRAADSSYWDHSNTVAYAVQILVPGVPEPAMTASVAGPLDLGPLGVSTAS
ncbi:MAG: hypothetical protein NT031_10975, partial [Planctomycetota bacterium]|nr:hypothetical protein [Planctomycetota bacterium]